MAREAAVRQRTLQQARVNVGTLFAIVVLRHMLALGCCVSWRAGERLGLQAGSQVHWSLSTLLGGTVAVRFHSVPQYICMSHVEKVAKNMTVVPALNRARCPLYRYSPWV